MALQARLGTPQELTRRFRRVFPGFKKLLVPSIAIAALIVFVPQLASAQRGGGGGGHFGGGGGGHFGGGGGHFSSGGGHAGGASRSSASSGHSGSHGGSWLSHIFSSRSRSSARSASASSASRASSAAGSSGANSAHENARVIPEHVTIGFPPRTASEAPAFATMRTAPAQTANAADSTNFRATAGALDQPVTFFGEGAEFWSESPAASHSAAGASANSVLTSRFTSANPETPQQHGGFHPAPIMTPRPMPRMPVAAPASTRPAPVRAPQSGRIFMPRTSGRSTSARPESFPRRPNPRGPVFISTPYFPIYPGFGGIGFGGFWGFGYGGLGFFGLDWGPAFDFGFENGMNCAPFWFEGCDAFYTGYDPYASCCSEPVDPNIGVQPPDEDAGETGTNRWVPPPDETTSSAQSAAEADEINAEKSLTVLYLTDGSVYAVTNFYVDDGKLTYETSYGAENSIPLSQLDLEATVKANAARGVTFTMRPKPGTTPTPAPGAPQPNAQPEPPATPQPNAQPQAL